MSGAGSSGSSPNCVIRARWTGFKTKGMSRPLSSVILRSRSVTVCCCRLCPILCRDCRRYRDPKSCANASGVGRREGAEDDIDLSHFLLNRLVTKQSMDFRQCFQGMKGGITLQLDPAVGAKLDRLE